MRRLLPLPLTFVVAPVCAGGAALVSAAVVALALGLPGLGVLAGAAGLLAASCLADRFPVPLDHLDANGVSLGFVFSVSAVLLFGWAPAVLVVALAPALMQALERRPPARIAFNTSVHALAAGAGALAAAPFRSADAFALVSAAAACALAQYCVNISLVSLAAGIASRRRLADVLRRNIASTALPFALMGSAALVLVVLWQRSPVFSVALLGPLLAIALYQRSHQGELHALRLALTDPLTGLGNHRDFHERLQRELAAAGRKRVPLTVCLLDVDDFKRVNDRYGHPTGDRVLADIASQLRRDGEAFRLGGDEFAVLLAGRHENAALGAAEAILARIEAHELEDGGSVTASAGLATFPADAVTRDELVQLADDALYWAKEHGKNRARLYHGAEPEPTYADPEPAHADDGLAVPA
ncbi:MAG: GGDEF domain-containing protein [Actinomycetota bacterium]|nr:GGDEF domain-containing protein [Actinomycetota bacterium]